MKLYATLKNERGGKKSTGDDTRILVELSYKNKIVGTIGLYSIRDEGQDLGYRVLLDREVIREEEKSKKQKDEKCDCAKCGSIPF